MPPKILIRSSTQPPKRLVGDSLKPSPLRGYSSDECVVMTDLLRAFKKYNEIMKCRCTFKYYKVLSGGYLEYTKYHPV